jgi:hypothetical protein
MSFILEFLEFLKARKKMILLPVFLIIGLIGALLVLANGSVLAPFIYTLF